MRASFLFECFVVHPLVFMTVLVLSGKSYYWCSSCPVETKQRVKKETQQLGYRTWKLKLRNWIDFRCNILRNCFKSPYQNENVIWLDRTKFHYTAHCFKAFRLLSCISIYAKRSGCFHPKFENPFSTWHHLIVCILTNFRSDAKWCPYMLWRKLHFIIII